jgi:hypothetical protein
MISPLPLDCTDNDDSTAHHQANLLQAPSHLATGSPLDLHLDLPMASPPLPMVLLPDNNSLVNLPTDLDQDSTANRDSISSSSSNPSSMASLLTTNMAGSSSSSTADNSSMVRLREHLRDLGNTASPLQPQPLDRVEAMIHAISRAFCNNVYKSSAFKLSFPRAV